MLIVITILWADEPIAMWYFTHFSITEILLHYRKLGQQNNDKN